MRLLAVLLASAGLANAAACTGPPCRSAPCAVALKAAGVLDQLSNAYRDCAAAINLPASTVDSVVTATAYDTVPPAVVTETSTVTADPVTATATTTVQTLVSGISVQPQPTLVLRDVFVAPEYLGSSCPTQEDYDLACACFGISRASGTASTVTVVATSTATLGATTTSTITTVAVVTTTPSVTLTATATSTTSNVAIATSFLIAVVEQPGAYVGFQSSSANEGFNVIVRDRAQASVCTLLSDGTIRCGGTSGFFFAQTTTQRPVYGMTAARVVSSGATKVKCAINADGAFSGALTCLSSGGRNDFRYSTNSRADLYLTTPSTPVGGQTRITLKAVQV